MDEQHFQQRLDDNRRIIDEAAAINAQCVMMGDGVIDIPRIRTLVEQAGYQGLIEVEIFSARNWWQRDPDEVIEVIKQRFADVV